MQGQDKGPHIPARIGKPLKSQHNRAYTVGDARKAFRESPAYWSLTWGPVGGDCESYQCRHGLGYSTFWMKQHGIHSTLRVFVPLQDQVEIWTVTLRNAGDRPRKLTLFPFTEWDPG